MLMFCFYFDYNKATPPKGHAANLSLVFTINNTAIKLYFI